MAGWFGRTQTITSISKSVSTVANGILGLEDNLATFMKKVIYYEKFFQRVRANLPKEVTSTAERLFARCYEYRDEIRDELECALCCVELASQNAFVSSLAYVADAGRWVVGMEDWNSKMEKRLQQISELVLLANSLLVEYAMTGKLGGEGSKDELDAYLRNIASSVVLKNQKKNVKPSSSGAPRIGSKAKTVVIIGNSSPSGSTSNSVESLKRDTQPPPVSVDDVTAFGNHEATVDLFETEDRILDGPLTPLTSSTEGSDPTGADSGGNFEDDDDDDGSLNPFACDYQPPVDKYSLESSLASLANDSSSRNSSIPDLATYDADADNGRSSRVHLDRLRSDESFASGDGGDEDEDELDSPVNLCEYECLDMDSIPKYDAFKPSIRSRVQRMNAVHTSSTGTSTGMHSMSGSNHSLASYHSAQAENGYPTSMQSSFASSTGDDRFQFADTTVTTASATATTSSSSKMAKRRPKRMMDMNYSYDFQREQDYNPFMSPPMTFLPDNSAATLGEGEAERRLEELGELDLSSTPKIDEEPSHLKEAVETLQQSEDPRETRIEDLQPHFKTELKEEEEEEAQEGARIEEQINSEVSMPERLSDYDETEALIAALAAASDDDYSLFGEAHE